MISSNTFKAIAMAQGSLTEMGATLSVTDDSPLQILLDAGSTPLFGLNTITNEEFYEQYPESLKRDSITGSSESTELSYDDGETLIIPPVGEHELITHDIVAMGRSRVSQLFDHSRNVFQPFFNDIIESYAEPDASELNEEWAIVDIAINEKYLHPVVEALLNQYHNPMNLELTVDSNYVAKIPESLDEVKSGRATLDNLISTILAEMNLTPKDVMVKLFSEDLESPYISGAWVKSSLRLVQWLLVNYYMEEPWEDSGLSTTQWEAMMSSYRNALTGWVSNYLNCINEYVECNTLVIGTNYDTKEIYVSYDMYKIFINDHGGKADTIYGSIYLNEAGNSLPDYSMQTFIDNIAACESAWARQLAVKENAINAAWLQTSKAHMKRAFTTAIDTLDVAYLPEDVSPLALKDKCCEEIEAHLDRFTMEDPTLLIIQIAGRIVFEHTDCGYVTENIHRRVLQGATAQEAATQVAMEYTWSWVFGGVTVKF